MSKLEGWGFLCLIGCAVTIVMSLSLLSGTYQAFGLLTGVILGVLAGGLYAASVGPRLVNDAEQSDARKSPIGRTFEP
jgi:hypothetical protein